MNNRLKKCFSVLLALLVWQAVSAAVGNRLLLSSPVTVAKTLFVIIGEAGFFSTVLFSLLRIMAGLLLAFLAAALLAPLAARFPLAETLLFPYVLAMRSVPVASFIILALIWLSFNTLTVFVCFLIVFPLLYGNLLQGIRSADGKLLEMASVFRFSPFEKIRSVYLPAVKPYILSAVRTATGMAWKAGAAAEVIGVVTRSIGGKLYDAKIYLQNDRLLAWTVILLLLSALTEKLFTLLLQIVYKAVEHR